MVQEAILVPLSNQGRMGQRKERDGLRLLYACARQCAPTAPTTVMLWETFEFTYTVDSRYLEVDGTL